MKKIDLYPHGQLEYPQNALENWQNNQGSLKPYSDYHYALARQSADVHIKYDLFTVIDQAYKADGWMDGMNVLFLAIRTPDDEKHEIKWHDTFRSGTWFKKHTSGGWSPITFEFPKLYKLNEQGLSKIIDVIYSWMLDSWAEAGKPDSDRPERWDIEYAIKKFGLKPMERLE